MTDELQIELLVSSNTIERKDFPDFRIGMDVVNNEPVELHFDVSKTRLYVNSKRNIAWDLAVQNGTIVNFSVPPGKQKSVQWPLGKALFEAPGTYLLELHWKSVILKQTVRVLKGPV
ncbi:hypothetical protein [Gaoshiqia sp. Z1-71]|uniref:hypothetical protein n=1 Tax=Gaoshiqia hydrogeniformans TaxID=3290090 RepID=UPI003BF7C58F